MDFGLDHSRSVLRGVRNVVIKMGFFRLTVYASLLNSLLDFSRQLGKDFIFSKILTP